MRYTDILEKCKERLNDEYEKDHCANRLATVINDLIVEFNDGDLEGLLHSYAAYVVKSYKYLKSKEVANV